MIARVLFMLFGATLLFTPVLGQDASRAIFTADRGTAFIGEPIQLTLTVQVPVQSIVTMPTFPQEWSSFMVKAQSGMTETTEGGLTTYRQILTVILWQPGDYQTPETLVNYQMPGSDQILQLVVEPTFFIVPSVLNGNDLALRPLKPPIALPYIPIWVIFLIAGCFVGVIIVLVYLLRTRRLLLVSQIVPDAASSFHTSAQTALRELKMIGERVSNPSEIYAKSADCLRVYVRSRFDVAADDMTTGELRSALQVKAVVEDRRQHELEQLLERADLVKFARVQPKTASAQQFNAVAQRWIQSVEQAESDIDE